MECNSDKERLKSDLLTIFYSACVRIKQYVIVV